MSRMHVARTEMRLSRPDVEPLRPVPAAPDPLAAFERVLEHVDTARGERAEVVVDLLPASTRERHKFRKRQRRHEIIALVDNLTGTKQGTRDARMGRPPGNSLSLPFYRNSAATRFGLDDVDQVARKVAVPTALFYVQVLMRVVSTDRHRASDHLEALIACWEMWAGRNRFKPAGVNLGFFFVGIDSPLSRWWFDYRLESGRFHPWRRKLLSAGDVAPWITPPTTMQTPLATAPTNQDQLQRHGLSDIAETLLLPDDQGSPGTSPEPEPDADDLIDDDLIADDGGLLLYGIGRRGGGVDRIAARLAARTARSGAGLLVLDADGTDRRRDVGAWPAPGHMVMPLLSSDADRPVPGWNPVLPPAPGAPVDRGAVALRALIEALRTADAADAVSLLDASLRTLRTLAGLVPQALAPTLFQVPRLVSDAQWRDAVLPLLDAPTRRVWTDVMPGMQRGAVRRVVTLLERLGDDPAAVALLGQPDTTYDPGALLSEPATVVLAAGRSALDDVLASLLWFDAARAAHALAEATEGPAPLVVATGTHRYGGGKAGLFVNDLTATVQSGVRMVLLTDRPDGHDADMRRALRDLATVVAIDDIEAGLSAAADWLSVDQVAHLRSSLGELRDGMCLVALSRDGWRLRTFDATRMTPPVAAGGRRAPAAIPGGRTLAQTRDRLDGLEERIAEHLARPAPTADLNASGGGAAEGDDGDNHSNVVNLDASRRKRRPRE